MKGDIMNNNTWDLEAMYASTEDWEKDFAAIPALADAYYAYRGRLSESADVLKAAIEALNNSPTKL